MKREDQNIEWKESWRDEHLKEICGFANAQGGRLYIGKDDDGNTVVLHDCKKLLVDIPAKVEQILGITVDVNLLMDGPLEYIEANIAPCSFPVSYHGDYYYRSGSANRKLKGNALTQFLLERSGRCWDSFTMPNVNLEKLDRESFDIFRTNAVRSKRMSREDVEMDNEELLDKLGLMDNGAPKRAAVMLFHREQDRYFSGCCVRIAKFSSEAEIDYQDEVRGSLFIIADRVIDLLYLKYLKASISYEKDIRVETYPYPREAVRELVFNALVHSDWSDNIPIQIRVDDDSLSISNCCTLPTGWTPEMLIDRHKSHPFNPDIARTFFRAGFVETWGRGIAKVHKACANNGNPPPKYDLIGNDLTVVLSPASIKHALSSESPTTIPPLKKVHLFILGKVKENGKVTQTELAAIHGVSRAVIQSAIQTMKSAGLIERHGHKKTGVWHLSQLGEMALSLHREECSSV